MSHRLGNGGVRPTLTHYNRERGGGMPNYNMAMARGLNDMNVRAKLEL